jgi:hypothetical protein
MVEWYDQMLGDLLPETREWLAKYFDDFKLNSPLTANADNDFAVFILCLEDLFLGCRRYDVELGPPKSSGGFHKTVFYGVEIYNSGGSGLARSRIDAIRALKYPENVSEMRQVLGLLTQCRKWVNMYSTSSNSLSHLLKNGVEWHFGDEQKRDFDALRAALIDSTLNYAPDYAHELILSTDASDYAIGSRLFQQIDDVEYNIGFWSRTLSLSEQKMAVYFRELLGILEGIRRARIYALSSPLPLRVLPSPLRVPLPLLPVSARTETLLPNSETLLIPILFSRRLPPPPAHGIAHGRSFAPANHRDQTSRPRQ